jgi:hypothetical protein
MDNKDLLSEETFRSVFDSNKNCRLSFHDHEEIVKAYIDKFPFLCSEMLMSKISRMNEYDKVTIINAIEREILIIRGI